MLLNSIMIASREMFEVALLLSLILSAAYVIQAPRSRIAAGIMFGITAAWLFAANLDYVSKLWHHRGQELLVLALNTAQFVLLLCLLLHTQKVVLNAIESKNVTTKRISMIISVLVGLALVRELSEIILYLLTYHSHSNDVGSLYLGTILGAGIGASFAVIVYFLFTQTNQLWQLKILLVWACLAGGKLFKESVSLLSQINVLPQGSALWDSSFILQEQSVTGHIANAIFSYDAHPTAHQLIGYGLGVTIYAVFIVLAQSQTVKGANNQLK